MHQRCVMSEPQAGLRSESTNREKWPIYDPEGLPDKSRVLSPPSFAWWEFSSYSRTLGAQLHENGDPLIAHSRNQLPLVAAELHQAVVLHGLQSPRQVGLLAAGALGKLGQRLRRRPANRLQQLAVFRREYPSHALRRGEPHLGF